MCWLCAGVCVELKLSSSLEFPFSANSTQDKIDENRDLIYSSLRFAPVIFIIIFLSQLHRKRVVLVGGGGRICLMYIALMMSLK